jgi:hypothetical protein
VRRARWEGISESLANKAGPTLFRPSGGPVTPSSPWIGFDLETPNNLLACAGAKTKLRATENIISRRCSLFHVFEPTGSSGDGCDESGYLKARQPNSDPRRCAASTPM